MVDVDVQANALQALEHGVVDIEQRCVHSEGHVADLAGLRNVGLARASVALQLDDDLWFTRIIVSIMCMNKGN